MTDAVQSNKPSTNPRHERRRKVERFIRIAAGADVVFGTC